MEISIFQVDAFTSKVFAGNPAAVCPLDAWLPDATLQAIAAENNLAETAFFVREQSSLHLRWFTPACEVDLCGHATLASAHVLFTQLGETNRLLRFQTKSGELAVRKLDNGMLELDFPSRPPQPVTPHPELLTALGGPKPVEVLGARDYLVRYGSEEEVRSLRPSMAGLMNIDRFAVIVTASGYKSDFVSRFFAPAKGVPEDPVTGSAHCTLTPYWAKELGKTELLAKQVSARGGEIHCRLENDRVRMAGNAVLFLKGSIQF
jgi:PhzF family phenazine biosynthesis protein